MVSYDKTTMVAARAGAVYRAWIRFGDWPRFAPGIERVTRLDEHHVHWFVTVGSLAREFTAEITEQIPGQRIAWRTVSGPEHTGSVTVEALDEDHTRLHLHLEHSPHGTVEQLGAETGVIGARLSTLLRRFARYVEHTGAPEADNGTELASGPEAGLVLRTRH